MTEIRRHSLRLVSSHPDTDSAREKRGKVTHDSRGTAIWDWELAPDVLTSTSTTGLLRTLAPSAGQLTLEEAPEPAPRGSCDPYNSSRSRRR
jgi:hypothetical protein